MANYEKVNDEILRKQLQEANTHLRAQKPTEAVHVLADAFLSMLDKKPELLTATTPGRRGPMSIVNAWPQLGASLDRDSIRDGSPKVVFSKERFAMSEAFTYYEFVVDTAINQGL